ncbi:SH3 domain-containing protein [Flavilitoribacter nigricans]|uniref:SH3b domain-containing protein n=1 Tax=Flavilitoribacter nigricans (strain ATCC 23147 / DSM 23189 / NBRC 102662 / NCIMB 1420 / SS-2) TaxID=1122177 RepID=A0A2D0NGN4_FLAN2|nr:SH3 domain-containing protein [Flavilitoribacter nigricans]PHN07546.1 hypothetical protein CRP01_05440 [Flavilitoribacter nigricans DSM 23189 = NBRC 102662]
MKKNALPFLEGFLFFCLLLIVACGSETEENPEVDAPQETSVMAMDLKVVVPNGRLRAAPDPQAKVIRQLNKWASLQDLGEVSRHTTQISFGAEKFDEPWLEVQDSTGQSGWIYAREVAPALSGADLQEFRRSKLLRSIFGDAAYLKLETYRENWQQAVSEKAIAETYRLGLSLRDTLVPMLENKSHSYDTGPLPDLFWIDNFIPAYVTQLVAEGTVYYLFNDYKQWLKMARKSPGKQDDRFFSLLARCYPQDSIEYFYPAWELQTWDYGGHHLLGRGITYDILAEIEQLESRTPLFSRALLQLKDQILADLTQPNIHFWEPDTLVKQELDSIIQANWSIFTATDRVALDTRRLQLDSAVVHGIGFNARAGE